MSLTKHDIRQIAIDDETNSIEESITLGHEILRTLIQRDLKMPHSRFIQHQGCLNAMQQLMVALGAAQGKQDTLASTIVSKSTLTRREEIDVAHEGLLKSIRHIKALMDQFSWISTPGQVSIIEMAYAAAAEALKMAFWETPFQIRPAKVNELIPREFHSQSHGSALVLLNRHDIPSRTQAKSGMVPCFQNLIPVVHDWMEVQTDNIFQRILSSYTPLPPHIYRLQWMRKVRELSVGFRTKQKERFETNTSKVPRIGVLGLFGLGKSTMINALIGEEILTKNNGNRKPLSAGWPIIIRHDQNIKIPRLSIEISNLTPILEILQDVAFDPSESPMEEPLIVTIWEEYRRLKDQGLMSRVIHLEGVDTIRNALHSIGKVVRAFEPLSREGKEFQLNSAWPVIEVCMDAFNDTEQSIEGVGNRGLVSRDVEAQWKISFDSCDAYIYTVKAALELLDSARLELNLEYLEVSMTYKGSPWLIAVTHSDALDAEPSKRPQRVEELEEGFKSFISGRGIVPYNVPVLLCSPARYLSAKKIQNLMKGSVDVPSRDQITSVGGLPILASFGAAVQLSHFTYSSFAEALDDVVQNAAMEQVSSSIKTLIIPQSMNLISKTAMSLIKEDIWGLSNHLQDVLTWNTIGNDTMQHQRQLSADYFQRAATFCASWSVALLENQREWHRAVDHHLLSLRKSLQEGLGDVWAQTLKAHAVRNPDSPFFVANSLKTIKNFEEKAESAHSQCEVRVKTLVDNVWAKCLSDLLQHLASDVFSDADEESYLGLRQLVFDSIEAIRKQSSQQVLKEGIQKLGKRAGLVPSALSDDAYWHAHEGHIPRKDSSIHIIEESLHMFTDLPKDPSNWVRIPSITSAFEQVTYLEQWKKHKEIAANAIEAVGFLVVSPHTPPRFKATGPSFTRKMSSTSLQVQLEEIKETWYESMRQQSLITLEGSLRAVSFIGIRAVLDVFIAQIHNLEVNDVTQMVSDRLKVAELEEVVTSEANAVCVWAALDTLTQIKGLDECDE